MKLNLDKQFTTLKGVPLDNKMCDTLADILAMSTQGKPAKMITWAVNLTNNGETDIEKADLHFLTGIVEESPALTNLAKVQLMEEFKKAENEEKA